MGIRDWFGRNRQENKLNLKSIAGNWIFQSGRNNLTVKNFTDTGIEYPDLYDNNVPMKLYTFDIYRGNLDSVGKRAMLGKMYETVAFEAPASWDMEIAINNGLLSTLLNQTNAINMSFNNGRPIDVLGRFDSNSNFTYSDPGIQDYVDNTYVPTLNEHIEQQRLQDEQRTMKENNPGIVVKATGAILDIFDRIKEKIAEIRDRREQKLLAAAPEEPMVQQSSLNEIKGAGRGAFRIGNSELKNVMSLTILKEPQQLADGSYLYTAKRQQIGAFDAHENLLLVPNCQFSLPVAPENFEEFLYGNARSNVNTLMFLLNQEPLPGVGLYIGGLVNGENGNLQYSQCNHLQNSIDCINGTEQRHFEQQQHMRTEDYTK